MTRLCSPTVDAVPLVGVAEHLDKECHFLKKEIRVDPSTGWKYSPDPKHAEAIIEKCGLNRDGAKGADTPGVKMDYPADYEDKKDMDGPLLVQEANNLATVIVQASEPNEAKIIEDALRRTFEVEPPPWRLLERNH